MASRCWLFNWATIRCYSTQVRPRITVPHRMVQKIETIKLKQASRLRQLERNYKGALIISCYRKKFNHYQGQTYRAGTAVLASGGWKHPKSKGDYFVINTYRSNPALDVSEEEDSFDKLGLNKTIVQALSDTGITTPTNIQAKSIPETLKRYNIICAAETGSGKTLAFLLPMMEWFCRHTRVYGPTDKPNQPFGVVITPSRELAQQIKAVADSIAPAIGLNTSLVIGGTGTQKILKWKPKAMVDLLITTPGVLSKMLTNQMYDASRLSQIVLDEADTLMDDSFSHKILRIIRKMNVVSERLEYSDDVQAIGTQLVLTSATMPMGLRNLLKDLMPADTVKVVTTQSLHRLMPHISQKFMRFGPSQKPEEFLKIIKDIQSKKLPTLVFCNKAATTSYLSYILDDAGIPNVFLNGVMSQKRRDGRFEEFQNGKVDVLVCTDIASRGLDTIRAQRIINYEFPNFMSDYIHRVGRIGRVGSHGQNQAVSFISYKWEVELLWKIESAARKATALENVNANIKKALSTKEDEDAFLKPGIEQMRKEGWVR